MEKSFDFGRLMKNHEKKHKSKPVHLQSLAGGIQRRLETNIKNRRSIRLTVFDNLRNLSKYESPVKVSDTKSKVEHRRMQLEKWKEEKDKRKKEAAAQKKKPFVAGVPHVPLKFVPPPPPPKPMPSTSGRITRSQTSKQNVSKQKVDNKQARASKSFAPKNAKFQAPLIKNLTVLPTLVPVPKKRDKVSYKFDPVLPNKPNTKQTRSKTLNNKQTELKKTNKQINFLCDVDNKSRGKVKRLSPKRKVLPKILQSSSGSDIDSSKSLQTSSEADMASSIETSPILKRTSKSVCHISSSETEPMKSPILINKTPRRSLTKITKVLTPKNPIPKSESSSEEKLRSPKSPVEVPMTPEQIADEAKRISPCVTLSRGKDNARKEMKKKMEEGLLDEDASDIECVNHFRRQLASEIKRITEMCEVWDKIQEQTTLSESIQELVLGAVGQARLLVSAKLQQFAGLVQRCARPDPQQALVTPADLAGFWDMVYMQVENIDMRFKKLEELRQRGWVEDKPVEVKKKPVAKNNAKKPAKPAAGASRLRDLIAAARKAKMQQEEAPAQDAPAAAGPGALTPGGESKTFEAGFFCVRSPVRTPPAAPAAPADPAATPAGKASLLKAVLSSEAKKSASKNSTSFAMLRASILSKNVDHDGIAPLPQTPINYNATPGRSILKSAKVASEKKPKKSIKVVLFDDSDNDIKETTSSEERADYKEHTNCVSQLSEVSRSDMDVEKFCDQNENKENSKKKNKLVRQDALSEDRSPVMTRSRRKSVNTSRVEEETQEKTPKRSTRKKKALQEAEANVVDDKASETPKRSVRSRRSSGLQSLLA